MPFSFLIHLLLTPHLWMWRAGGTLCWVTRLGSGWGPESLPAGLSVGHVRTSGSSGTQHSMRMGCSINHVVLLGPKHGCFCLLLSLPSFSSLLSDAADS
jgi:hypothetical protein